MRHTIVIELPEGIDAENERRVERELTSFIEASSWSRHPGRVQVVEYHHEQMTTTEENP